MKKDPKVFLVHILESIEAIEEYLQGVSEETFHVSREKQDLAVRRLEIIGEASKNIPDDFRNSHPDIPWKRMSGMRDMIAHQYFGINYNIVWDTVKNQLPSLKAQIKEMLKLSFPDHS